MPVQSVKLARIRLVQTSPSFIVILIFDAA